MPGHRFVRGAKGVLTTFVLWAGALTMVVPTPSVQAATPLQATVPPQAAAAAACSGFQDDFAADYPGSLNSTLWDQNGAVAGAAARQLGTPLVAPGQAGLTDAGWRSQSAGFSALQSTGGCSGPFTFSTVFEADAGLNHFGVSLVSADLSQEVTVEGNTDGMDAGIWAGNSLSPAGTPDAYRIDATLCHHLVYAITISVDASGSATVTLSNYYDHEILGTSPAIPLGTGPVGAGPLYVLLGQGPGTIIWGTASLVPPPQPCSIEDDFGADTALSAFWTDDQSSPQSALTSVATTIGANFQTPSTDFRFTQPPGPGMYLGDGQGHNGFTAVQSVDACAAPFTFSATVKSGDNPAGNSFDIDFVSQDLTQVLSVQGNLDPYNRSDYGIWAGDTLTPVGADDVVPEPAGNTTYTVTVSVDEAGMATVTVSSPSGSATSGPSPSLTGTSTGTSESSSEAVVGSVNGLNVGRDPLYVLLGQQEEDGHQPCPFAPLWEAASLASSPSAPSGSVTASISAANPTVAAVETVPAGAVPASAVVTGGSGGTDPSSAPLSSISLSSAPLSSIPLSSIPLSSIALGTGSPGTATAAAANTLGNIPLSELTITYPPACAGDACTGWQGIVAGTSLSGLPLQSITLGQVLADSVAAGRFDSTGMVVGDLGLSSSPLSSIPLSSIPLSSIPLSSIPLPGTPVSSGSSPTATDVLTTWCTALSALGESCTNLGIDPSNPSTASSVTLLTLALAGVPLSSIPLSSIPLSSIPLSSIPLSSIPLSSIPLSSSPLSSIPLSSIPLSSIPLSSIPLSSIGDLTTVVNCAGTFTCSGQTLGAAATADALEAGATLGNLVSGLANPSGTTGYEDTTLADVLLGDDTSVPGYPDLTLGDLLISLVPPQSYPWQSVDLAGVPLAQDESAGGSDQFTVPLQVSGGDADVQLTVSLPPTFAYVAGSATIDGSPAPAPTATSPLTWSVSLPEGPHTLSFKANAGIYLGPATASVTASTGSSSSTGSTTVTVTDGEEPDNTVASATPLAPDTLDLGFMTSATDINDWSVTVSQGQELALALTNLPAQYDLELFSPAQQQLQGLPSQQLAAVDDTVPGLSPGSTFEPTPGSQDIPVTPPSGYQLYALANVPAAESGFNGPDAGAQYIQTPPLDAGTYIVQISGYNGATSSQPYLLRAALVGGGPTLSCPSLHFPFLQPAAPTNAPTVATGANTLFLVDTQRLTAAFGASSEATVMADVEEVAADSAAGVNGAVIPVDSYPSVQEAYTTWDEDPCSVQAANDVVAAISAQVDAVRANDPDVTSIVVIGADDQIPFARLADGTVESNERDYAAGTFPGENNVEADALADGYYFSDDPFAAPTPLGVGSATLYLPTAAVGRLIQSPDEGAGAIEGALTRFVASGGDIDATAGLATGYSFLASGAELVSDNLAQAGLSMNDLINDSWTSPELEGALAGPPAPGVDSINAHFDYSRALPSDDNTSGSNADLFTTTAVSGNAAAYAGRLLFSMGCHAGLDINGLEVAASGIPATPDWASTFSDAGALWVANTGFGYGDTTDVAYSAALMADFARQLGNPVTIGQALTDAKQQYAAGSTVLSPYDLKSVMESTLYGLPMYTLNGPSASSSPSGAPGGETKAPVPGTDPITGLPEVTISTSLPVGSAPGQLSEQSAADGTNYYQVNGTNALNGSTLDTEFRPIEPQDTVNVTQPSSTNPGQVGLIAHGALIDALGSEDITGFTPTISQPDVSTAIAPGDVDATAFPSSLQRIATYQDFSTTSSGATEQQLDLVAGQFIPGTDPGAGPAAGQGTQRLFTQIGTEVLYTPLSSPVAADFTPPTVQTSSAVVGNGDTDFVVTVVPGESNAPVKRVLVLYTPKASPGTWTPLDLALSNGDTWTGAAPNPGDEAVQYFVEAVDAAGNVANSNNNGSDFGSSNANGSSSGALSIALSGSQPTTGYFQGPVTASVSIGTSATAPLSYVLDGGPSTPLPTNDQVIITGDGEHTLTVTDAGGDEATSSFDIDTLGPRFNSATTPDISANGWVPGAFSGSTGSVLEIEVTDPGAAISSLTYQESGAQTTSGTLSAPDLSLPLALPMTANGATTVTLSATDQAGLKSPPTTVTVDVDATAPTVQCTVATGTGPAGTGPAGTVPTGTGQAGSGTGGTGPASAPLDHNVSVSCGVTDFESGISADPSLYKSYSSTAANFTLATSVAAGQSDPSATTPSATVCSVLGDCTTVGPFGPFNVDLSPPAPPPPPPPPPVVPTPVVIVPASMPTVSIISPPRGAVYLLGQKVRAGYTCADAGSGIAACTGKVPDGSFVGTGNVGKYNFSVTATNNAGRNSISTVSYSVEYKICPAAATVQSSSTVVFKVYLCDMGGADVTSRSATITASNVDAKTVPIAAGPGSAKKFTFVASAKRPYEMFRLNAKLLSAGPHTLGVTVAGDPETHSLPFIIKRSAPAGAGRR